MIAITYALPSESLPLQRALRHQGTVAIPHSILGSLDLHECLLIHTGLGMERTQQRLATVLDHPQANSPTPRLLISAGYAGALSPEIPAGSLFLATNHSAAHLLEISQGVFNDFGVAHHAGELATSPRLLETPEEKAALAKASGAHAVDMETAVIAELCRERGLPMLSLRVISDNATDPIPVPFSVCIDEETGLARPLSIALHLARHPWRIPSFLHFAKQATRSREELARALSLLMPFLHPL